MAVGCDAPPEDSLDPPEAGIPESKYDLFASLVRNIDSAEKDLELAKQTKNRVNIGRAQFLLDKQRNLLDSLFTQKYGRPAVTRWKATVHEADRAMVTLRETNLRGAELFSRFKALGANGQLDEDGYIIILDCKGLTLPKDMVMRIANCQRLKKLTLRSGKFEDAQFQVLARLTNLTHLDLSDNQTIKGTHLSQLGMLTKLDNLNLSNTSVGDDMLPQFEAIKNLSGTLRNLDISNTKLDTASYDKITRLFKQADVKY